MARHFGLGTEYKKNHTYSALSKCQGNGSIRLTATMANRIIPEDLQNMQKPDIIATDPALQPHHHDDVINCLKNKCPNHHHQYRHRCISISSQSTLLTTVSKNDVQIISASIKQRNGDLNETNKYKTNAYFKKEDKSALGTIAEKLRRGTRKVLHFTTTASNTPTPTHTTTGKESKLQKDSSMDSAHTNTISNSSLQEVDAEEFDSAELAKYMGEINNEIR